MGVSSRIERIEQHFTRTDRFQRARPQQCVTLGRGVSVPRGVWEALSYEDRHLAQVLASRERARREASPVYSDHSAAVILGLPLVAEQPLVCVTTGERGSHRRSGGVVRRPRALDPGDVIEIAGLRCTHPDRTLLDLARFASPEQALACADAYLRDQFRVRRNVDTQGIALWKAEQHERLAAIRGGSGTRRARHLLELADARCDSVLESISHLRLKQLGFEVDLQVPVPARASGFYFVDFELRGIEVLCECDGRNKYRSGALPRATQEEPISERLYREKRRQEWIESTTGKRIIRWGWPEVVRLDTFRSMLVSFGVPLPPRAARRIVV